VFRALRRAGLDVQGGPGCDPAAPRTFEAAPGRWAAVAGARGVVTDARAVLRAAATAGARLVAVVDLGTEGAPEIDAALAAAGARAIRVDPRDLAAAEAAARGAAETGAVIVALSACPRGTPAASPFAIAPSRCNRCGACLALGCPAISDPGGEAMAIDAGTCTGCSLCAPLCRARAIVR
jgi:TPP-dependent indolepyruvate ferredoxin oxidoreductase alpha subunit